MVCRKCGIGTVPPSFLKCRTYRCSKCLYRTPGQQRYRAAGKQSAAQRRYRATPKGKAMAARSNAKRLLIGQRYVTYTRSPEQAALVRAHIRQRLQDLRQQQRQEAECHSLAIRDRKKSSRRSGSRSSV